MQKSECHGRFGEPLMHAEGTSAVSLRAESLFRRRRQPHDEARSCGNQSTHSRLINRRYCRGTLTPARGEVEP